MDEQTKSIADKGILQPITVMETKKGMYQIIAGERRYRASKDLGLNWIPAYTIKIKKYQTMLSKL